MTKKLKTALMIMFYDQADIEVEDYLRWDESDIIDNIIDMLIEVNYENRCPFKGYSCQNVCPLTRIKCEHEINIDCGNTAKTIWDTWINEHIE